MTKTIYLLGAGGHGRVVLDALLESELQVTGVLDMGLKSGEEVFGVKVLGGDEILDDVLAEESLLVNGLGSNPNTLNRQRIFVEMKKRGFEFLLFAHPSAVIGRENQIGEGCQIMAGAVLQCRIKISENVVINTSASVDHDCKIGAHAFISPSSVLCGNVSIGELTFIGASSVIMPGIHIGKNSIVGAGSVVTKNVPNGWTVEGNPAVKIMRNY